MSDLIIKAARFANKAHTGQLRKFTEAPYVTHPMRVANAVMLLEDSDPEMVAAAMLHDTIEDTSVTYPDLLNTFGKIVAELVLELTNQYTSKLYPKINRAARKEAELKRIAEISREAKIIKMLDRLDNLREIDYTDGFTKLYCAESAELLRVLKDAHPEVAAELASEVEIAGKMCGMISSSTKPRQ